MIPIEVASKYARALLKSGGSKETVTKRLEDLEDLLPVFARPNIRAFLTSPHVSEAKKQSLLEKTLPASLDKELRTFLLLLLKKRRFKYLPEVVSEYRQLIHDSLDELEVQLLTATPADSAAVRNLEEKLAKRYNKQIQMKQEVDSKLLGGGILLIGNQMVDFSIRSKLNKLKEDLLSINV